MARSANRRRDRGDEPPGLPTDPDKLDDLGVNFCLRKLTMTPRTQHELSEALAGRDYPADSIERITARLRSAGYINDELFAALWVESRHRGKGLAKRALSGELHRKGIDRDVADEAVESIDAESERTRARALASAKFAHMSPAVRSDARKLTSRLVGLLARKGYGSGLAFSVVSDIIREEQDLINTEFVLDELHQ